MALVVYRDLRPHGGPAADLLADDGRIAALGQSLPVPDGATVVDAGGALALPSLVDAHCHPDKTSWGQPWLSRRPAATLAECIRNDVQVQTSLAAPVAERAGALMTHAAATGVRAMRAHVDVAPVYGLGNLYGIQEAAQRVRGVVDVQIVAFPQLGLLTEPGTARLLEDAVESGADLIGGLDPIGVDHDLDGHLDVVFGIAERHGVGIDIHLHDDGELGLRQVAEIARRTHALGLAGQVTISHAFSIATCAAGERARVCELLAATGVSLATCAHGDAPVLPVEEVRAAGVRLVLGSDGVRDAWSPFGTGDMFDRVHLLGYRTGAVTDAELERCYAVAAHEGAALLGLERAGLRVGDPADFVLVAGENTAQVVVDRPEPRTVVRHGRVVAVDGTLIAPAELLTARSAGGLA